MGAPGIFDAVSTSQVTPRDEEISPPKFKTGKGLKQVRIN
jgi:hypothetical protein